MLSHSLDNLTGDFTTVGGATGAGTFWSNIQTIQANGSTDAPNLFVGGWFGERAPACSNGNVTGFYGTRTIMEYSPITNAWTNYLTLDRSGLGSDPRCNYIYPDLDAPIRVSAQTDDGNTLFFAGRFNIRDTIANSPNCERDPTDANDCARVKSVIYVHNDNGEKTGGNITKSLAIPASEDDIKGMAVDAAGNLYIGVIKNAGTAEEENYIAEYTTDGQWINLSTGKTNSGELFAYIEALAIGPQITDFEPG